MRSVTRFLDRLRTPRREAVAVTAELPLDLLAPAFIRDPYPTYAQLRRNDPVHRTRSGGWLVTRHADVVSALSHPALGNAPSRTAVIAARNRERHVAADVAHNILPFLDKPDHVAPRRLIAGVFRAHLKAHPVDAAEPARAMLRGLRGRRFDALADFGTPLSVAVMGRLMGLPEQDHTRLMGWSDRFFYLFAPMPSDAVLAETNEALAEFRAYLHDLVEARRRMPGDDLISALILARDEGFGLSAGQIVDNSMLLFADGIENVDAVIANTLLAVHAHPEQRRRLDADHGLVAAAVGEALRYDSPGQIIARVARDDLELGGRQIKRDAAVFLALASANRDAAVFENPDRFDVDRDASALLSFGKGRHSCIGAPLVRLQVEGALKALLEAGARVDADAASLAWKPRLGHRWLTALPVRLAS